MNLNRKLSAIAEVEFSDVVEFVEDIEEKLEIYIQTEVISMSGFRARSKAGMRTTGNVGILMELFTGMTVSFTKNGDLSKLFQNICITVLNTMFVIVRSATNPPMRLASFCALYSRSSMNKT